MLLLLLYHSPIALSVSVPVSTGHTVAASTDATASLSLATATTAAASSTLDAVASVSLGVTSGFSSIGILAVDAALSIGIASALSGTAGLAGIAAVSLPVATTVAEGAGLSIPLSISAAVQAGASGTCSLDAPGSFSLSTTLLFAGLRLVPPPFPRTTLTHALRKGDHGPIRLASTADIFEPDNQLPQGGIGTPSGVGNIILMIGSEAIAVQRVSGLLVYGVRGSQGTEEQNHDAGAMVYAGPAEYYLSTQPTGACNAAIQPVLPRIYIATGELWDVVGGVWVSRGLLPRN